MILVPFRVTNNRVLRNVDSSATVMLGNILGDLYNPPSEPEDKRNEDRPQGPKSGPRSTR